MSVSEMSYSFTNFNAGNKISSLQRGNGFNSKRKSSGMRTSSAENETCTTYNEKQKLSIDHPAMNSFRNKKNFRRSNNDILVSLSIEEGSLPPIILKSGFLSISSDKIIIHAPITDFTINIYFKDIGHISPPVDGHSHLVRISTGPQRKREYVVGFTDYKVAGIFSDVLSARLKEHRELVGIDYRFMGSNSTEPESDSRNSQISAFKCILNSAALEKDGLLAGYIAQSPSNMPGLGSSPVDTAVISDNPFPPPHSSADILRNSNYSEASDSYELLESPPAPSWLVRRDLTQILKISRDLHENRPIQKDFDDMIHPADRSQSNLRELNNHCNSSGDEPYINVHSYSKITDQILQSNWNDFELQTRDEFIFSTDFFNNSNLLLSSDEHLNKPFKQHREELKVGKFSENQSSPCPPYDISAGKSVEELGDEKLGNGGFTKRHRNSNPDLGNDQKSFRSSCVTSPIKITIGTSKAMPEDENTDKIMPESIKPRSPSPFPPPPRHLPSRKVIHRPAILEAPKSRYFRISN